MFGDCQLHGDEERFLKLDRFKDDLKMSGAGGSPLVEDRVADNRPITRNNSSISSFFIPTANAYIHYFNMADPTSADTKTTDNTTTDIKTADTNTAC